MSDSARVRSFVEAQWERANDAYRSRDLRAAEDATRRVASLFPAHSGTILLSAMCAAKLGLLERATLRVRRAHAVAPTDPLILVRLAEAMFASGDFAAAESGIRDALDRGIAAGEGSFLLARALWAQGRTTEATLALDRAVAADASLVERRRILEHTIRPDDFAPRAPASGAGHAR